MSWIISFILLAIAESRLDFKYTTLFEMNDFHGTPYYAMTMCKPGCRVYLTYPNDDCTRPPPAPCLGDQDNGPFTIEVGNDHNITFLELNNKRLENGEMGFFTIPEGTDVFSVHNPNGNGVVRPLALWVVPNDIPRYIRDVEVYYAGDATTITSSENIIVLMSVAPFTLTGTIEGEYELFVKTSPIDMMSEDECEYVLDIASSTTKSFSLPVNSPLISLGFNSAEHTATLTTDHTFSYDRSIDAPGYVASPGYIGCFNKTFVFHSESYNYGVTSFNETFVVQGAVSRMVSFYGDINTDTTAPIWLYDLDTDKQPMMILGNQLENTSTWEYSMKTSSFSISWDASAYPSWRNESFMIRYTVDLPKLTTPSPHITTTSKPSTMPSHPPTTPMRTTFAPTTTSSKPVDSCTCNPSSIYLDIVFIVDTSAGMPLNVVGDATATIQSTLYGLTFGTSTFQSNVAALAYAESVQTVANFGDIKSYKDISRVSFPYLGGNSARTADAINQASSMINANARVFTRGVIVLLGNSYNEFDTSNIESAASEFKSDGGILISIDYSKGVGVKGLEQIANPGYYIKDASSDLELNSDMLYALCDANCFCREGLRSYNAPNSRGRDLPDSCYHVSDFTAVYYAAEQNCQSQKGFVATIHDDDKNFFMTSLFPVKAPFWIGLEKTNDKGEVFVWADGSNDPYTNWASENPVNGMDCVYGQQQSGFNTPWFSAPCADPLKNSKTYACQLRPCSSEYDCWA